jgi:hypothetical protein
MLGVIGACCYCLVGIMFVVVDGLAELVGHDDCCMGIGKKLS